MTECILKERGYFWWNEQCIPDGAFAPSGCVVGTLTVDGNGKSRLELDGVLDDGRNNRIETLFWQNLSKKCIQGILKDSNQSVLLLGLRSAGKRFTGNGISCENFEAASCLVGSQEFSPEELKFDKLEIKLTGFEEWLGLRNIKFSQSQTCISVEYNLPCADSYRLDDGTLKIKYENTGLGFDAYTSQTNKINFEEIAILQFEPTQRYLLDEMRNEYVLMQELFILLTGSNYSLDWPCLKIGNLSYRYYFEGYTRSVAVPRRYECLTEFSQLKSEFGSIVCKYKEKRNELRAGFNLYLAVRRGIDMYVEHRFVSLIWGLESMHREKPPEKNPKLEEKVKRIIGSINGEKDKCWLEGKLKHATEPQLKDRLLDLFSSFELPFGIDKGRLQLFCEECAKARNKVSHSGEISNNNNRDDLVGLDRKSAIFEYLYHAILLLEIGISPDLLEQDLSNVHYSTGAKYWLREALIGP